MKNKLKQFHRHTLERNIFVGFGLALVLVIVLCLTLYYNASHFLEMNAWVEHTRQVIKETDEIDSALKDVESSMRGYVISGDEKFLENYEHAQQEIALHLAAVRSLTADNPHQQQRLDLLVPFIKSKLGFSANIIETRRRGDIREAQNLVASGIGKSDMNGVGNIVAAVKQEENDLLKERGDRLKTSEYRSRLTLVIFGSLILILFVLIYLFIRRELRERQNAVSEIKKREELYRTLVRAIPKTGVLLFDSEMRYTLADGEELNAQGFSQAMFEGKTLWEVFPPEISREWADYYTRALGGEQIVFEQEMNGRFYQTYILPVRKNGGEIFAGMVKWKDISERKQIENTLRESEQRYRDLIDKSLGLICTHNLEGILLSVNPAAAHFLGYEPAEMVGKSLKEFLTPEGKTFFNFYLDQIRNDGEAAGRMHILTRTGEPRIWQYNNILDHENGKESFVMGHAQDITELKAIEGELRESRQMFQQFMNNSPTMIF